MARDFEAVASSRLAQTHDDLLTDCPPGLRRERTRSFSVLRTVVVLFVCAGGGGCPRSGPQYVDDVDGVACISDPEGVIDAISRAKAQSIWAEGALREPHLVASIAFWSLLADAHESGRVHASLLSAGLYSQFLAFSFSEPDLLPPCDEDHAAAFRSSMAAFFPVSGDCHEDCSVSWTAFRESLGGVRGVALDGLLDRLKKSGQWRLLLEIASVVKDGHDAAQDWKTVMQNISQRWDTVTVGDAIGAALSAGAVVATIYGAGSVVAVLGAVSLGLTIADEMAAAHEARLECIRSCTFDADTGGEGDGDGECSLVWCIPEGFVVPLGCECSACCSQACNPSSDGDVICVCIPSAAECSASSQCCSGSCIDFVCT